MSHCIIHDIITNHKDGHIIDAKIFRVRPVSNIPGALICESLLVQKPGGFGYEYSTT